MAIETTMIIVAVILSNVTSYLMGSKCTKIKTPCFEIDRVVKGDNHDVPDTDVPLENRV